MVVYGPIGAPIAILMQVVLGITLLLGFIPVVGVFLYGWLAWFNFIPWVTTLFGVEWTWTLTVMFLFNLAVCVGCTIQALIRIFTVWWRIPI